MSLPNSLAIAGNRSIFGARLLDANATADDWAKASGLDFTVAHEPVFLADGAEIPGRFAVTNQSNRKVYSFATSRRKDPQPREILEFFSDVAGLPLEVAGAQKGGAVIWALAKNEREITIKGEDTIKPYLLLSTSYDGSRATSGQWTTLRYSCDNMLNALRREGAAHIKVRHTSIFDVVAVKRELGLYEDRIGDFERTANLLAERKVTGAEVQNLLVDLFGSYKAPDKVSADSGMLKPELTTYSQNVIEDVIRCVTTGPGSNLNSARGTAWGLLNGVTDYVDHHARAHNVENRRHSAMFGAGQALKADAFASVREMVPVLANAA